MTLSSTPMVTGPRLGKGEHNDVSHNAGQLLLDDLNKSTLNAKYAVRGSIPIRADELQKRILKNPKDHGLPFDKIVHANIGNPHQLKQQPLTWYRQVLSLMQYPAQSVQDYPEDVVTRAREILDDVNSLGAYSNSQGSAYVRNSIAKFLEERDGHSADPSNIFLTSGASTAVAYLLQLLLTPNSAFLIPIPQYPLYTACIALNNSTPIGYYLNEKHNWATDPEEIEQLIQENKHKDIKALVVINPGNPTGSILDYEDIAKLIELSWKDGLVIIADEVYQNNVFEGKFYSFKKVLSDMILKDEKFKTVQLASLHSTSKGVSGECGQRGGYMELVGFTPEVKAVLFKLACISLCSVVSGQALVELMVNPPKRGDPSYETYHKETSQINSDLRERATTLHHAFEEMEDVLCNKPQGAMYLFPRLRFSEEKYSKLYDDAKAQDIQLDELYCLELLYAAGICCVPGNGFGQEEGTWHLRTTFLPPGLDWIERWGVFHKEFVEKYKA